MKNDQSRLFRDLANVPRDFCLLLTGTPLQNSTEELWSLLNFSDKNVFGSKESFTEQFGQLSDAKQVSDLHSILKPYLLRRVKEDVEKALPPKVETILEVTLTPIQVITNSVVFVVIFECLRVHWDVCFNPYFVSLYLESENVL